jgi:hypothetical protein
MQQIDHRLTSISNVRLAGVTENRWTGTSAKDPCHNGDILCQAFSTALYGSRVIIKADYAGEVDCGVASIRRCRTTAGRRMPNGQPRLKSTDGPSSTFWEGQGSKLVKEYIYLASCVRSLELLL